MLCLVMTFDVFAQTRDYIVEMVVFKRPQASAEAWPKTVELVYPESRAFFVGDRPPASAKRGNNVLGELGPASYALANAAQRLNRQGGHEVLFHKAWRQSIGPRNRAPGLVILGGDSSGDNRELSGYVELGLGRYLHVNANLWLTQFGSPSNPDDVWPNLPSPFAAAGVRVNTNSAYAEISGTQDGYFSRQPNGIRRIATLSQHRRMRSNEPHYIDHPLMGILIEVRKISEE